MTEPKHLTRLNPQQHQAVTTVDGPLLILAGAGSGKTRVLTRRIAHLLHLGVEPDNILAVTFTKKAAEEMKERVIELVGEVGDKVWVSTFHSTCGRVLRTDIEKLGYTRRFSIYDDDDQLRILRQLIQDRGWDIKHFPPKKFLSRIDNFKNRMLRPEDVVKQKRSHVNDPILQLWQEYEESLQVADAIDFNDLIGLVVRLFREHPDVLQRWQEQFQYIMVDEYQDTNAAQYELLRNLASQHRNIAVVGDDDQSIYGFRGADISNILGFQQDYQEACVIHMEQNYRCSSNILAIANAVVAVNTGRIEKKLWTEADSGPMVNLLKAPDSAAEAAMVARGIKQLRGSGRAWEDMTILYRSNSTARIFAKELSRQGVPYNIIGARDFFERREIRDAIAYLRLIVNPADDAAFMRVCNVPSRGIGAKTLAVVREEAGNRSVPLLATARALANGSTKQSKSLAGFISIIDSLSSLARDMAPAPLVTTMLQRSGYAAMLAEEDTKESTERLVRLQELVVRAQAATTMDGLTAIDQLQTWMDAVTLTSQADDELEEGKVSLMTVHNSKGLEYPVIFVVQMMEGCFPHSRSLETAMGIEEERRLAYVAFTRAKERLIISYSDSMPSHNPRQRSSPALPSRFLFSAPPSVCVGKLPKASSNAAVEGGDPRGHRQEHMREFLRHRRADQGDDYAIFGDIERLDQLQPGTRVFHPRHGRGTVRNLYGTGSSGRLLVTFDSRRTLPVALVNCPLKLVLEEDEEPSDQRDTP